MRHWAALVVIGSLSGCAARTTAKVTPDPCAACAELDSAARSSTHEHTSEPAGDVTRPAETRWLLPEPAPDRWAVRRIGAARDEASGSAGSRPRRVTRVDIDLVRAPFDETARLLSDAGRFSVVVEAPSASSVTARLKAIEPYDALVALAEARGLAVRYEHGVVVVGAVKPPPADD